ncbi:MAG TPA: hypothetical protein VF543_08960 [Pyrinomonadaceae bacterium]
MKRAVVIIFITMLAALGVAAQEKGVDRQNDRIRDQGQGRGAGENGAKQDVGSGRGMDFGKGRTVEAPPIANPYRFTARRDTLMRAIEELMRDRKLILDEAASKPNDGVLITQPYTFTKGAVVSESELNRYAEMPVANSRGWTRGRYTLIVEIQPIDAVNINISVNAKIEGRNDGASGAEWVTLRSSGQAEQDFLAALIENVTGAPAPGREPSEP